MEGRNIFGIIWLGVTTLWLATVVAVSAMNAVVWLTSVGLPILPDVRSTVQEYYSQISFLLWMIFAVKLFYGAGVNNWKTGKFHSAMISYPLHGVLFTIVSSMLRSDANMSWQAFLTVVGFVFGVTVLYSCVVSRCFK